jgi:hypothetical protein
VKALKVLSGQQQCGMEERQDGQGDHGSLGNIIPRRFTPARKERDMTQPPELRPETNGLAIAGLICGLLGCLCLPGIVGLVLSSVALYQIGGSRGAQRGKGLALAGLVLSIVMMLVPVATVVYFKILGSTIREQIEKTSGVKTTTGEDVGRAYREQFDRTSGVKTTTDDAMATGFR